MGQSRVPFPKSTRADRWEIRLMEEEIARRAARKRAFSGPGTREPLVPEIGRGRGTVSHDTPEYKAHEAEYLARHRRKFAEIMAEPVHERESGGIGDSWSPAELSWGDGQYHALGGGTEWLMDPVTGRKVSSDQTLNGLLMTREANRLASQEERNRHLFMMEARRNARTNRASRRQIFL